MRKWSRNSKSITSTKRWRLLRAEVLERDRWRCGACGARGRLEVDHVRPVRDHPAGAYDPANLQTLCGACHSAKTRAEVGLPPLPEPRRRWREAIAELSATPKSTRTPHA